VVLSGLGVPCASRGDEPDEELPPVATTVHQTGSDGLAPDARSAAAAVRSVRLALARRQAGLAIPAGRASWAFESALPT
jgi:hypothetical protein